ncbi:MAG TPA: hypothetical protein VNG33_17580, partial [Polyangiaceae bacterium]|nr:hypothetical protein [Polyangiaceae bacterium]
MRLYEHEQPTPALLNQHIDEMDGTLQLIDEMLNKAPYQPGVSWINELPLDDAKAKQARALIDNSAEQASFVRVYAEHVRSVLKSAPAALPTVPGAPSAPDLSGAPTVPSAPTPPRNAALSQWLAAARPDAP